jgi:hypothetical protein
MGPVALDLWQDIMVKHNRSLGGQEAKEKERERKRLESPSPLQGHPLTVTSKISHWVQLVTVSTTSQ